MDDEEKKAKLQNYSEKALMKDEPEGTSYAGLILNGAAQQKATDHSTTEGKRRKSTDSLLLKLALHDSIEAMNEAVNAYIEKLNEEIAVLEVKRDTLASEIERLESELRLMEEKLITIQESIDQIATGNELELDESGTKLRNPKLEALISEYEKQNGVVADRSDTALLLAILEAEQERLGAKVTELENQIREENGRLGEIQGKIDKRINAIREAEDFKQELERIGSISSEAEREEALGKLFEKSPDHVLDAMKDSHGLPAEAKQQIENYLENRTSENAEEQQADAFWDDVLSEESEPAPANAFPKPFA